MNRWALVLVAGGVLACSAVKTSELEGGSSSSGSNSSGTGAGDLGGNFNSGGSGPGCGLHCSSDLHQVLDCNDQVVTTCPPDQGCGADGLCVPPCEAANANKSTLGCDFYSVIPGPETETRGSCFAALIANTWTDPVTITASWGGQTQDGAVIARIPQGSGQAISYQTLTDGKLQPGQIAIVFLSQYNSGDIFHVPCPAGVQSLVTGTPTEVFGTGIGNAFHITTNRPIVAYDIFPWGGASSFVSSATLLVPTSAWGDNFVSVDAYETDPQLGFVNGYPHTQIVAAQGNTAVTISPTAAIVGGAGVQGTGKGQPVTYNLNGGQMLQLQQPERLIGSPIQATGPISVWGGTACMRIPINVSACDSAHQQLMHVQAQGHSYLGVQYRSRVGGEESVPYTIVGAVDGTGLSWDPAPPAGAPSALNSGQSVIFESAQQFSVTSQDEAHPFYLAVHMTGGQLAGDQGDPEYVNIVAPKQWLDKYLFVTDPTYGSTNLVFTRQRGADMSFKEVNLDCAGVIGGWQPIGAAGQYEFTRVDLALNGSPVGGCDNGVHTANSDAPFGLTVWGWDSYVSYGYPAGMSVKGINTVVVPPTPN